MTQSLRLDLGLERWWPGQLRHAADCAEALELCLGALDRPEIAFGLLGVWNGDAILMAWILVRYLQHGHMRLLHWSGQGQY